jgi:ankyrin repeat protein
LNRHDVVQVLLTLPQIDPSTRDENGRTSLFDAAGHNAVDFLQILSHPAIDINVRDNDGNTALMYAVRNRLYGAIEPLIYEGIDINAKNHAGVPFLFIRPLGIWHILHEAEHRWTGCLSQRILTNFFLHLSQCSESGNLL